MNIEKRRLNAMFDAIAQNILDDGFELYSIDGNVLFELRGFSGGATYTLIYYIIKIQDGKHYRWGARVSNQFWARYDTISDHLRENCQKFITALAENKAKEFDVDGGDLGTGDN